MNIIISGCEKDTSLYEHLVKNDNNVNIVSIVHTADATIHEFLEKNPDLLILDATTNNLNILCILSTLSNYNTEICKKVILIVDEISYKLIEYSKFLSVIQKPITQETLIKSIYKIYSKQPIKITVQDVKKLLLNLKIDL